MTFEEPARSYRLVFEDEDYAGAEVVCRRRVPMSVYFDISRAQEQRDIVVVESALRTFGEHVLESWNVTAAGQVLPSDGDGMLGISPEFALMIIGAWLRAITDVPVPLVEPSANGLPPPELSIPMVPLSANPGSS